MFRLGFGFWKAIRLMLGGYFLLFFADLFTFPKELFTNEALRPENAIINIHISEVGIAVIIFFGALASLSFLANFHARASAFSIWLALLLIIFLNPYIKEIQFDLLGWLLWFWIFFPSDVEKETSDAKLALLFALAATYWISGWAKLDSRFWRSGETLLFVQTISRFTWLSNFVENTTAAQRSIAAGLIAGFQLLAGYGLARGISAKLCWYALGLFQIALLASVHFEQVNLGVLIFQIATWPSLLIERPRLFKRVIDIALVFSLLAFLI
jgi:hypothetical protein